MLEGSIVMMHSILIHCFFQTVLGILGDAASSAVVSGGSDLQRPLSSAQQTFPQNADTWPVGEPIPKIEAPIQCSGEWVWVCACIDLDSRGKGAIVNTLYVEMYSKNCFWLKSCSLIQSSIYSSDALFPLRTSNAEKSPVFLVCSLPFSTPPFHLLPVSSILAVHFPLVSFLACMASVLLYT